MYNENIKEKYVSQIVNKETRTKSIEILDRIEENADRDIATMTKEGVISVLESLEYTSYKTLITEISYINSYLKWYRININELDPTLIDGLSFQDVDLTDIVKRAYFSCLEEITQSTSTWFVKEGYFVEPIAYLLWSGIKLGDILDLKNTDLSFSNGVVCICVNNEIIEINNSTIVDSLFTYSKVVCGDRGHRLGIVYANDLGYFIKNFAPMGKKYVSKRVSSADVSIKYARCNNQLGKGFKKLSTTNIFMSGKLYRVREDERRGMSLRDAIRKEFGKIEGETLRIYECYKRAFVE